MFLWACMCLCVRVRAVRNFMKDREQHKDLAVELGNGSVLVDPCNKRVNFVSALQMV